MHTKNNCPLKITVVQAWKLPSSKSCTECIYASHAMKICITKQYHTSGCAVLLIIITPLTLSVILLLLNSPTNSTWISIKKGNCDSLFIYSFVCLIAGPDWPLVTQNQMLPPKSGDVDRFPFHFLWTVIIVIDHIHANLCQRCHCLQGCKRFSKLNLSLHHFHLLCGLCSVRSYFECLSTTQDGSSSRWIRKESRNLTNPAAFQGLESVCKTMRLHEIRWNEMRCCVLRSFIF